MESVEFRGDSNIATNEEIVEVGVGKPFTVRVVRLMLGCELVEAYPVLVHPWIEPGRVFSAQLSTNYASPGLAECER